MKTSLNGAGLNAGGLDFAGFVELAARHHYEGVDFGIGGARKLADERGGPEAVRTFLAEKNVAPATFGLDVEWRRDDAMFQHGLDTLAEKAAFAQAIGAARCCTWMPPAVAEDPAEWEAKVIRRFREIARVLGDQGVRFGIEWVGPKTLREGPGAMGKTPWIYTMDGTLGLIERIGEKNVGLLVDSYHCYATGIGEAAVANLTDDRIVHVHINDAKPGVPVAEIKDGDRLVPGDGVIDLAGFLNGLRSAGYTGFIAAEVLSPQPIAGNPEAGAARIRTALKNLGL